MIMPEWLIHRYHQEERIDETDQDQQYCRVTDQEARDEYYSSTPDVLTKSLAEDKFRTTRRQMCGHEPEQAEAKDPVGRSFANSSDFQKSPLRTRRTPSARCMAEHNV
jgi:hypothetical protein